MKELAPLFLMTAVLCNQSYAQHMGYLPQQQGVWSWVAAHSENWLNQNAETRPAESGQKTSIYLNDPDLLTQTLIGGDPMMNMASIQSIIDEVHHLKQNKAEDSHVASAQKTAQTAQTHDEMPPQTLAAN